MDILIYSDFLTDFLIVRDGPEIIYIANEKEEAVAKFLARLVEERGYSEKSICLDVEIPEMGQVDAVIYEENKMPLIMVEWGNSGMPLIEKKIFIGETVGKAKALKARYAVVIMGNEQQIFDMENQLKQVSDLPDNNISIV